MLCLTELVGFGVPRRVPFVYVPPTTNLLWDYNPGKASQVTLNSGNISAIANDGGADPALAQATANKQPALLAGELNGFDVARLDGSNDFMRAGSTPRSQPMTRIMVLKVRSVSGYGYIGGTWLSPGFDTGNGSIYYSTDPIRPVVNAGAELTLGVGAQFTIDQWVIFTTVVNGASSTNRRDKITATTGNAGSGALGMAVWGGRADDPGALYGAIDVARDIAWGEALDTTAQDAAIEGLATQYGLTV